MERAGESEIGRAYALARELGEWASGVIAGSMADARGWLKGAGVEWVTEADVAIERHVRQRLRAAFPDHRVAGEEDGSSGPDGASAVWAIDPVDGTNNFAHGVGWCAFSLGLVIEGEPVLGVIEDPFRRVAYHARRGHGAFADDRPIRVRAPGDLRGEIVLTELDGQTPWDGLTRLVAGSGQAGSITRIMGSTAMSMAHVARGAAVAAVFGAFDPLDSAAGLCLLHEAGAVTMGRDGVRAPMPRGSLIAASAPVAEQLRSMLADTGPSPAGRGSP